MLRFFAWGLLLPALVMTGCAVDRAGLPLDGSRGLGGSSGFGGAGGFAGAWYGRCSIDKACPLDEVGPWSACEFATECDGLGTKRRTITTFECVEGECEASETVETDECFRDTGGVACGPGRQCGPFDACAFDASDVCDEVGEQTAPCQGFACVDGVCQGYDDGEETRTCFRDTDRLLCKNEIICEACACVVTPCTASCAEDSYTCLNGECVFDNRRKFEKDCP